MVRCLCCKEDRKFVIHRSAAAGIMIHVTNDIEYVGIVILREKVVDGYVIAGCVLPRNCLQYPVALR